MLGYIGNSKGNVFNEENFSVVKKVLAKMEKIDKHNHPGKMILFTIVKGTVELILEKEDTGEKEDFMLEPGTILKFDGEYFISAIAKDFSEIFVTIIDRQ